MTPTPITFSKALPCTWEEYCSTNGRRTVGFPFLQSGCRKRGCNKRGCLQTRTNARKRKQTQTNADFRLSEKGPKTQVNAHKRAQTRANADKREQTQNQRITPPFTHPLLRQPNSRLRRQEGTAIRIGGRTAVQIGGVLQYCLRDQGGWGLCSSSESRTSNKAQKHFCCGLFLPMCHIKWWPYSPSLVGALAHLLS